MKLLHPSWRAIALLSTLVFAFSCQAPSPDNGTEQSDPPEEERPAGEQPAEEPAYEVSASLEEGKELLFEALAEEFTFQITAEGPWRIEVEDSAESTTRSLVDWVSLTLTSGGSGVVGIGVTLKPNLARLARIAYLKLYHQKSVKTYVIRQQPCFYEVDGVVTLAVFEKGTLRSAAETYLTDRDGVTALRIVGSLNGDDVSYLRSNLRNLTYLDLRGASLESFVFSMHQHLRYLYLPDALEELADFALESVPTLEYVHGAGIRKIGRRCFWLCRALKEYYLPETVEIGDGAFEGCTSLPALVFPKVQALGIDCFRGCSGVSLVSLDKLEVLDKQQLSGNTGPANTEAMNLPSLQVAGDYAFAALTKLRSLELPSVRRIGSHMLEESAVEEIHCPVLQEIPENAFYAQKSLRRAIFERVINVRAYAFFQCTRLKDVSMPLAEALDGHAFYGCTLGGDLDFSTVKYIGQNCFENSEGLGSQVVRFPDAVWIGPSAFQNCTGLVSIEIPYVGTIGDSAFMGCSKLTRIGQENRLAATHIGNYVFMGCIMLHKLDFPLLTELGTSCFEESGLGQLSFGVLNWSRKNHPDDLWPLPPFEFWEFPISQDQAAGINLHLGRSPFPVVIDEKHPWWTLAMDGRTVLFMKRSWASVD